MLLHRKALRRLPGVAVSQGAGRVGCPLSGRGSRGDSPLVGERCGSDQFVVY